MAYPIKILPRAERDLSQLYHHVNATESQTALRWYKGLKQAILTLEADPCRCPFIPEDARFRHLLYGRKPHVYRIIYRIFERKRLVEIMFIRDGKRDGATAAEA